MKYLLLDNDTHNIFLLDEITDEIEKKIKEGYYELVDLETMETINSNRNGLFRRKIEKY